MFSLLQKIIGTKHDKDVKLLWPLVAEINEKFDEMASYCGLVPREHSSGESTRNGTLLKRRDAKINKTIIESSWVAISKDPALLAAYNKLV